MKTLYNINNVLKSIPHRYQSVVRREMNKIYADAEEIYDVEYDWEKHRLKVLYETTKGDIIKKTMQIDENKVIATEIAYLKRA